MGRGKRQYFQTTSLLAPCPRYDLLSANPRLAKGNARIVCGNFDMAVNLQPHLAEISFQSLRKIGVLKDSTAKGDTIEAGFSGRNHCCFAQSANYAIMEASGDLA